MRTAEDIIELYHQRRKDIDPIRAQAIEVRDTYNGEIVVPLPELNDVRKPAVANLLQQGLDHLGMRISSVQPDIWYPAMKPGVDVSEKNAKTRRQVNMAWWRAARMNLKDRKRARYLVGYASSPVVLWPDFKTQMPTWQVRDPLTSFPSDQSGPDDLHPSDCIFSYKRTWKWLKEHYDVNGLERGSFRKDFDKFDVVEYVSDEQATLIVLGKESMGGPVALPHKELVNLKNRTGVCWAVVPGRITLDKPMGQYDGIVGLYQMQARLMALEVIAVEEGIFPRMWWYSADANRQPNIMVEANGKDGTVGMVSGGTPYIENKNPTYLAGPTIDRIEYAQRQNSVPAEFGGQSTSNIRTGRRGEQVLGAAVDPWVQEAQEILAASKEEENRIAVAIDKTYWGETSKSVYVGTKKDKAVTYVPNKAFESDENLVSYSFPGTDVQSLTIMGGSLVGMGILPKKEFARIHPLTQGDSEAFMDQVTAEGIDAAVLSAFQTAAATPVDAGGMHVADAAAVAALVRSNKKNLYEAIEQVQAARQAQQAQALPPESPEIQPGLEGTEPRAPEEIPEGEPSMGNLRSILGNLRMTASTVPAERGPVRT